MRIRLNLRLLLFLLITSVNSRAHLSYLTPSKPGQARQKDTFLTIPL